METLPQTDPDLLQVIGGYLHLKSPLIFDSKALSFKVITVIMTLFVVYFHGCTFRVLSYQMNVSAVSMVTIQIIGINMLPGTAWLPLEAAKLFKVLCVLLD